MNNSLECPQTTPMFDFFNSAIISNRLYKETPFIDDIVIHIFRYLSVEKRISGDLASTCYQFYKISKIMQMEVNQSLNQACSAIVKNILNLSYYKTHPSLFGYPLGESLRDERLFHFNFDSLYSCLSIETPYKPIRSVDNISNNLTNKCFVIIEKMNHDGNATTIFERSGVTSLFEGYVLKKELSMVARQAIATINQIRGM